MILTIPICTVSEPNARGHWATKARRAAQQRVAAHLCLRNAGPPPALPVQVTLTRVAPRALDDDNLRSALKAVRDQVAVWLGLPLTKRGQADDRDPGVTWQYGQERGRPREYAVRVEAVSRACHQARETGPSAALGGEGGRAGGGGGRGAAEGKERA